MPSTTPDSRTISATSSVMSVTWRPPVVWKCRSAWKTFIAGDLTEYLCAAGPVAQRLEQGTHNSLVGGSNPPGPFRRHRLLEIEQAADDRYAVVTVLATR